LEQAQRSEEAKEVELRRLRIAQAAYTNFGGKLFCAILAGIFPPNLGGKLVYTLCTQSDICPLEVFYSFGELKCDLEEREKLNESSTASSIKLSANQSWRCA
jgi:hypothetical protein